MDPPQGVVQDLVDVEKAESDAYSRSNAEASNSDLSDHHEEVIEAQDMDPEKGEGKARTTEASVTLSKTQSNQPYTIFSERAKLTIVIMVSISALISPFAATLYYPALNALAAALDVTPALINLSITTYMICQAIAPAIVASISDQGGRRLSFIICFTIFTIANIGLALQTNYAALMVLRGLQSTGSSGAIALAIAVVSDVATSAERGKFVGFASAGILTGPAFGPVIGGALADTLGWRAIFWFLVIFGGCFLIIFLIIFPETCRNVVGNGSIPAHGINLSLIGYVQQRRRAREVGEVDETVVEQTKKRRTWAIPNPLLTLKIIGEKESALILIYNGIAFSGQMIVTSSFPSMLAAPPYNYNDLQVGLCFLPLGVGAVSASLIGGYLTDWNFRRHAKKVGLIINKAKQQDLTNFPIERARIEVILPHHFVSICAILTFGWLMQYRVNIAGPEIASFCIGYFVTASFNVSNTLLIDLHRKAPATATAAVNLFRCLISAGFVAAIIPMTNAMGRGWAFTFFAFLQALVTLALFGLWKWGPKWRKEQNEKEAAKAADEKKS